MIRQRSFKAFLIFRPIVSLAVLRTMATSAGAIVPQAAPSSRRTIAVGQLRSTNSKLKSLIDAAFCAKQARDRGAAMLFLPENFGFMGESPHETVQNSEPIMPTPANRNSDRVKQILKDVVNGSVNIHEASLHVVEGPVFLLDGLKSIASESGLYVSACLHTSGAPPLDGLSRVYNTHFILDEKGSIHASYNKIHLFDVAIPGQVELRESKSTAPGTEAVVCDSPVGRLGLSICYDLRFPRLYQELVKQGAEVLLIPAAFTVPTGSAHWHVLLRARAIETQCYVVAAAQYGVHNSKRESYGHSLVVDPWGKVMVDAGGVESLCDDRPSPPSVVCCEIDLNQLHKIRQQMPVQKLQENAKY